MRYSTAFFSILLVLVLSGCGESQPSATATGLVSSTLPMGATDVTDIGNGWWTFKWRGQCFMMGENGLPFSNYYDRAFSKIDCPEEVER